MKRVIIWFAILALSACESRPHLTPQQTKTQDSHIVDEFLLAAARVCISYVLNGEPDRSLLEKGDFPVTGTGWFGNEYKQSNNGTIIIRTSPHPHCILNTNKLSGHADAWPGVLHALNEAGFQRVGKEGPRHLFASPKTTIYVTGTRSYTGGQIWTGFVFADNIHANK